MLDSINPTTEQKIKSYPEMTTAEWSAVVDASHSAHLLLRTFPFKERARLMRRAGEVLLKNKERYARVMTDEMGKPIVQGRAEVEKCAGVCEYYAEQAPKFLASEVVATDARKSYVTFQPLGVILAVMPWNFPFWQVFRFAAPALMAGNAGVLKHAANVSGCALAIEEVFREAGFPTDAFRTLLISSKAVADVIAHPRIMAVTLTGSTGAGQAVARQAGAMLKKSVLELGGSDAYIVLEDADLEAAAMTCVNSRLINSGQSCIAAKRFIVVEKVRKRFEKLYVAAMKTKKMGDPLQEDTDIGPQARMDLRDGLHDQVQRSISKGATLLLGGELPHMGGAFYPATVLSDVKKGMAAYDEEIFGPIAAIIPVKNEAEAVRVANDSVFGLGAAVFTKDIKRGERIAAEELEAGSCFVNTHVRSDSRLPFGGIKQSGYGRELSSFGIREFVNIKTVFIGKTPSVRAKPARHAEE